MLETWSFRLLDVPGSLFPWAWRQVPAEATVVPPHLPTIDPRSGPSLLLRLPGSARNLLTSHGTCVLCPQVIKNRFHRVFLPSHSLDTVSPSDTLLCFELLSPELAKERVVVLEVQQVSKASP